MNDDEFNQNMHGVAARRIQSFDQQLAEVKSMYDRFTREERQQFKTCISKAGELEVEVNKSPADMNLRLEISQELNDDQGDCIYYGHASISPHVLVRALEAWETGDEFAPKWGGTY